MVLRVEVPFPTTQPAADVADLVLEHRMGQIIDSGPVWSEWGEGQLVLTSNGVIICDTENGDAVSINWSDVGGEAPEDLDPNNRARIPLKLDSQDPVELQLDGHLFANMSALSRQFDGEKSTEKVQVVEPLPDIDLTEDRLGSSS